MKLLITLFLLLPLAAFANSNSSQPKQGGEKVAHVHAASNDDAVKTSKDTKPRVKRERKGPSSSFKK